MNFGALQTNLKNQSAHLASNTHGIAHRVIKLLDGKLSHGTQELTLQLKRLDEALKRFHGVVDHPEIIFATTGTTSSGKSTLVNLLCGAFIMPEAVGEMSAGVVEIEHGERVSVEIFPTKDSNWFIGRRDNISDSELQALLTEVMHTYNDRRADSVVPECPRIKVVYPTRLGREISSFGLPSQTPFTLKILDLPGLKFIGDNQNAHVISAYCKRAMSFVTYNASETDPHKQESLLKQVVGQVKEIGGTPARMMFILNRFDVYENDANPEESKRRAFTATQNKIREILARELPEYRAEAEAIKPVRLATKPALLIERGEFKDIERYFGYLVDEDVMDELPRKVDKWTDEHRRMFSDSVLKACYVNEFRESLRTHVGQHLPQILFPSAIAELKELGLDATLHKVEQLIQVVIETAKGNHQQSLKELDILDKNMKNVYINFKEKYKSITKLSPSEIPANFNAQWPLSDQEKSILAPLSSFYEITQIATNDVIEAILEALISNQPLSQDLIDQLPQHDLHLLNKSIQDLKNVGYSGAFASQGNDKYEERSGTGFLTKLNIALNQISSTVAKVLPSYINAHLNRESKRIVGAITIMTDILTVSLHEEALKIVKKRIPLNMPQSLIINQNIEPIVAKFEMNAGFSTSSQTRKEFVRRDWEKVGEKRTWYTLWLGKKDVYDYVDKYEQRSYDNASIPSIYSVVDGWMHQIEGALQKYTNELQSRVEIKLNESYEGVVTAQQKSFAEFKHHLEEAALELDQTFRHNVAPWEALKTQQETLRESVRSFSI